MMFRKSPSEKALVAAKRIVVSGAEQAGITLVALTIVSGVLSVLQALDRSSQENRADRADEFPRPQAQA